MNTLLFKLLTGEFVIAEMKSETDTQYQLKNPAVIVLPKDAAFQQVYLAPFIPLSQAENVSMNKSSVVAVVDADEQLVKQYNKIFGSGIIIAQNMPN